MRFVFILSVFLPALLSAQNDFHKKSRTQKNEFDFGVNCSYMFSGNPGFYKAGPLSLDRNVYNKFNPLTISNFDFTRPCKGIGDFHFGFKRIISGRHCVVLDYQHYISPGYDMNEAGLRFAGAFYHSLNIGYGYKFSRYKNKLELMPSVLASYRFRGAEAYMYFGSSSSFDEPFIAFLKYNSIGLMPGSEVNWFFTKNFGLGVNAYFSWYPFEKYRLVSDDLALYDPSLSELLKAYKPSKASIILNMKIVYRFALL